MTQHPYSLTAPTALTLKPGASGEFTIVNSGTRPIVVHESLARYSLKALKYPAADHATTRTMGHPWLTVSGPADFTLAPGQGHAVHIASSVPAGTQGDHALDVLFTASPAHAISGPLHLAGGVVSTVTLNEPGIAVPAGPGHLPSAPHAPGHGLSYIDVGGIALAVVLVLAAVLGIARRARGRRAAA